MEFVAEIELRSDNAREEGDRIRQFLQTHKVLHIRPGWHIADLRNFYDQLTDSIGDNIHIGEDFVNGGSQTGEKWLEIRYDADIPDMAAYRHSKNAQPLHTDESYIRDPANVMFFYCVNRAQHGGATVFVDGDDVVDVLAETDPGLLERLLSTKVCYQKASESRTEQIISRDASGLIHFNFNYYCVSQDESEANKELNERFHEFLQQHIVDSSRVASVLLNPGEAVAWWDELVLHGRSSFVAQKTNDRFIWKTGIRVAA